MSAPRPTPPRHEDDRAPRQAKVEPDVVDDVRALGLVHAHRPRQHVRGQAVDHLDDQHHRGDQAVPDAEEELGQTDFLRREWVWCPAAALLAAPTVREEKLLATYLQPFKGSPPSSLGSRSEQSCSALRNEPPACPRPGLMGRSESEPYCYRSHRVV